MTWFSKNAFVFGVVGLLCSIMIPSCTSPDYYLYNPILTAANERDLGNQLSHVIADNPTEYSYLIPEDHPEIYEYLGTALQMVKNQTIIKDVFDWEILVLDDRNTLSAYTLPGGKMVITSGLLIYLEGEHQLVALLAHEAYYVDRINDGAPMSLSEIMQKVKDAFLINTGAGTKLFIDVIDGDLRLVEDIIREAKAASYDPSMVFKADAFAIDLICENYLYSPYGLSEILAKVQSENTTDFTWLENKPPSLNYSKPPEFTMQTRTLSLDTHAVACDENELEINSAFQNMLDLLP